MAPRGFTFIQIMGLTCGKEFLALSPVSFLQQQLRDRTYFNLLKYSPETPCQPQKEQGLRFSTSE